MNRNFENLKRILRDRYDGQIDLGDLSSRPVEEINQSFLTRSLATLVSDSENLRTGLQAISKVTDGFGDNGIDLIGFDKNQKAITLIQTKCGDPNSGIDYGDFLKFIEGADDLMNLRFDKFNSKIDSIKSELESVLQEFGVSIQLIFAITSTQAISTEVYAKIQQFRMEYSDDADVLLSVETLSDIIERTKLILEPPAVNLEFTLLNIGESSSDPRIVYGLVSAAEVLEWFNTYGVNLFSKNIRSFKGQTVVNEAIENTLKTEPETFHIHNNGITILCKNLPASKKLGTTLSARVYKAEDASVVNGAQTVGSIHRASENGAPIDKALVFCRIVEIDEENSDTGLRITKNTNTQNRVEVRDFVALDPFQKELEGNLKVKGREYFFRTGEIPAIIDESITLEQATIALACRISTDYMVLAKSGISKLWDDTSKKPYIDLFNGSLNLDRLVEDVDTLRSLEESLKEMTVAAERGRGRLTLLHGNRFIYRFYLLYSKHSLFGDRSMRRILNLISIWLSSLVDSEYPSSYPATIFKSPVKCRELEAKMVEKLNQAPITRVRVR